MVIYLKKAKPYPSRKMIKRVTVNNLACFLHAVGKHDAKSGHSGTTFAVFIRLCSSLQDGRTLYSKQSYVFLFFEFNGFWRENDVTRLTARLKFYLMA